MAASTTTNSRPLDETTAPAAPAAPAVVQGRRRHQQRRPLCARCRIANDDHDCAIDRGCTSGSGSSRSRSRSRSGGGGCDGRTGSSSGSGGGGHLGSAKPPLTSPPPLVTVPGHRRTALWDAKLLGLAQQGQPQQQPWALNSYYDTVTPGIHPSTYVDPFPSTPAIFSSSASSSASSSSRHLSSSYFPSSYTSSLSPVPSPAAVGPAEGTAVDASSYFLLPRRPGPDLARLIHRDNLHASPRRDSLLLLRNSAAAAFSSSYSHLLSHGNGPLCRPRPQPPNPRTMARRESLSELRAANPDLALSGNIISATFNLPHALAYRKDGDWVRRRRSSCTSKRRR